MLLLNCQYDGPTVDHPSRLIFLDHLLGGRQSLHEYRLPKKQEGYSVRLSSLASLTPTTLAVWYEKAAHFHLQQEIACKIALTH